MEKFDIKEIRTRAQGRWFEILSNYGIGANYLKNANGPCPVCSGKDRFRWDNKNGDGGGFCHQCDFKGSGITLLGKWLNLSRREDFPKLLKAIVEFLGSNSFSNISKNRSVDPDKKEKFINDLAKKIWDQSVEIKINEISPATKYFAFRGLNLSSQVLNLRLHGNLDYYENRKSIGKFPALIAKIVDVDGNFLAIHRTYLDHSGKKANLKEVKLALGKFDTGAIQFDKAYDVLNVAEGIETALSVREMTQQPTWSAISAGNLAKLKIPASVKIVYIWADLDKSKAGENAAYALASRLHYQGIKSVIHLPKESLSSNIKSIDWLDIYNERKLIEVSHA